MSAAVHFATLFRMHADALDVYARAVRAQADAVEGGGISAQPTPRYATAKSNPLGSARAFLDAGRRGDFPTFKQGRCVAARWADVEAYMESRTRPARVRAVDDADDDRALLEKAGIRLRPSNRRTTRR